MLSIVYKHFVAIAGSTCCCLRDFFGYCFTWACCPLPEATCCEDLTHCCPKELPVCDTDAGRCIKVGGLFYLTPYAQLTFECPTSDSILYS